jgi:hypothetical protein
MLYTADAVESCFAEKLQAFACGDDEAHAILASIVEDEPDAVALPPRNVVGARVLRELAASTLEVLDQAFVVDPFDVSTLRALPELARRLGVDGFPETLKGGDLAGTSYDVPRRVSSIIYQTTSDVGLVSRSSLDNPRVDPVHTNYSLYRLTPAEGSDLRVSLRRTETKTAIPAYIADLRRALELLNATPEVPLDHPDVIGAGEERPAHS